MTKNSVKIITNLQNLIEECYQEGSRFADIIPYKRVIFKGFYNQKIYQEILDNEEIAEQLEINSFAREKIFQQKVQQLEMISHGSAWPLRWKTWITLNPTFLTSEKNFGLTIFAEKIMHETAHAVICNIDVKRGHYLPSSRNYQPPNSVFPSEVWFKMT